MPLQPSIENEYQNHIDDEYGEFIEWKEKKLREKGLTVDGSPLGDSIHPDSIKSFNKLKIPYPDSIHPVESEDSSRDEVKDDKRDNAEDGE